MFGANSDNVYIISIWAINCFQKVCVFGAKVACKRLNNVQLTGNNDFWMSLVKRFTNDFTCNCVTHENQ